MAIGKGLERLQELFARPPDNYHPTLETFPPVDSSEIKRSLRVIERATERGKANLPSANMWEADEVEQEIVGTFNHELISSNNRYLDEQELYDQRLQSLNFQGQFAFVDAAVAQAIADFRVEARNSLNSLEAPKKNLKDAKSEYEQFRNNNRLLHRAAHYPSGGMKFLQVGLIAVLFLIEAVINGSFLRKGGGGWIGGTSTAIAFAFVNIVFSAVITNYGIRQLFHRNYFRKLVGLSSLGIFVAIVLGINTVLAIYRELSSDLNATNIEQAVIEKIRSSLQSLPDGLLELYAFRGIDTYMLLLVGIIFAVIVMIDVLKLDDIYPGYGKVDQRYHERLEIYDGDVREKTNGLKDIRDEAVSVLDNLKKEFATRREEYEFVLDRRRVIYHRFESHISDLQTKLDYVIRTYRETNAKHRSEPIPPSFQQSLFLQKLPLIEPLTKSANLKALNIEFDKIVKVLSDQGSVMHSEYEKAVERFPTIESIHSL